MNFDTALLISDHTIISDVAERFENSYAEVVEATRQPLSVQDYADLQAALRDVAMQAVIFSHATCQTVEEHNKFVTTLEGILNAMVRPPQHLVVESIRRLADESMKFYGKVHYDGIAMQLGFLPTREAWDMAGFMDVEPGFVGESL